MIICTSCFLIVSEIAVSSCGICSIRSQCEHHYGTVVCHHCFTFLSSLSEKSHTEEFTCHRGYGGCQLIGISIEGRCRSCWLSHALLSCTMPSLLHDRLRKKLPQHLKERVPTSLARSVYSTDTSSGGDGSRNARSSSGLSTDGSNNSIFGSIVDLPGGWKRKTGAEVVVISPSGEKFKSVEKLEEYLYKLGVKTDATILFGGTSNTVPAEEEHNTCKENEPNAIVKKHKNKKKKKNKLKLVKSQKSSSNNCIVTQLPGGWVRRTKFRQNRRRFDVYVSSPDGRTFRSRKHLSAYFHQIGKVDDILKYFPLFHDSEEHIATSSEITETESSTEPGSGKCTEDDGPSSDDAGVLSDCDSGNRVNRLEDRLDLPVNRLEEELIGEDLDADCGVLSDSEEISSSKALESKRCDTLVNKEILNARTTKKDSKIESLVASENTSQGDFIGFEINASKSLSSQDKCLNTTSLDLVQSHDSDKGVKKNSITIELPGLAHLKSSSESALSSSLNDSSHHSSDGGCKINKLHKKKKKHKDKKKKSKLKDKDAPDVNVSSNSPKERSIVISEKLGDVCESVQSENIPKAVPPLKPFQTQHLDGGWSRKIKWNPDGSGKVSFVVTPSGSKIQSVMELQAYLKKEGSATRDASFYFAQELRREDVPVKIITPKASKANLKPLSANASKTAKSSNNADKQLPNNDKKKSQTVDSGPRIKRVCRSLEQVTYFSYCNNTY